MASPALTIYRSSNGDIWLLVRDPASGAHLVRHVAEPERAAVALGAEKLLVLIRDGTYPHGTRLLVANQKGDTLTVLARDPDTGLLTDEAVIEDVPSTVCLLFVGG